MLKRKIRNLAVTGITIVSATLLTVLGATGASATVTVAASPGHAAAPAGAVTPASHVSVPFRASASNRPEIAADAALGQIVNYNSNVVGIPLCLGISGNNINAPAVQWDCDADAQRWYTGATNSAGYYQIYWVTANGTKQCLGVAGGSTSPNAQVVGWNCLGTSHPDQYWLIGGYSCSKTYFPIWNYKASGRVLGVAANSTKQGAAVVIYGYQNMCNNQFWGFTL